MVLIITPKLLQAVEMLFTSSCISCSVLARSSSKRRSLMALSLNFVTACKHLWLNSVPLNPYQILMFASQSLNAWFCLAENIMLNSVWASMQPCLTLLVTGISLFVRDHHEHRQSCPGGLLQWTCQGSRSWTWSSRAFLCLLCRRPSPGLGHEGGVEIVGLVHALFLNLCRNHTDSQEGGPAPGGVAGSSAAHGQWPGGRRCSR